MSKIDFRTHMVDAVKSFATSTLNGVFINSCFAHCQSERQDTWYAPDSPTLHGKVNFYPPQLVKWFLFRYKLLKICLLAPWCLCRPLLNLLVIGTLTEQQWEPLTVLTPVTKHVTISSSSELTNDIYSSNSNSLLDSYTILPLVTTIPEKPHFIFYIICAIFTQIKLVFRVFCLILGFIVF